MRQTIYFNCWILYLTNSTSAQNFTITKIEKRPSTKPINKLSTAALDDLSSLFYSTDRGIAEDYGIINRLLEITPKMILTLQPDRKPPKEPTKTSKVHLFHFEKIKT